MHSFIVLVHGVGHAWGVSTALYCAVVRCSLVVCFHVSPQIMLVLEAKRKETNHYILAIHYFSTISVYVDSVQTLGSHLLSQKSHGKGLSSQWRNLIWIFKVERDVHVMSQRGHFIWFTGGEKEQINWMATLLSSIELLYIWIELVS